MITFYNPGEIDIRGATIAGLSAKTGDTPIGYFGTGLKYAIARVLAWGGKITIYSGLDEFVFSSQKIDFRGAEFSQIVYTNGGESKELGFTTEYGKNWKPWQVFRELYANAIDEGGTVEPFAILPKPDQTTITIECDEVEEMFSHRNEIILPAVRPSAMVIGTLGDITDSPSLNVYYRKVRIDESKSILTYNIEQEMQLTEDRTPMYRSTMLDRVSALLARCTNEKMIAKALTASKGFVEADLYFGRYYDYSPEFVSVASALYKQSPTDHGRLHAMLEENNPDILTEEEVELSPVRKKMLSKAIRLVEEMGISTKDYDIAVAELGASILGKYYVGTNKIRLSPLVFEQGTKQVLSTLYEELIHATTGHDDCTYAMQTFLFNKIISLYEEYVFADPV